jgi:N-succinyldiaminopimelate aminotransferase
MGSIAGVSGADFLRLENLDVDLPPDAEATSRTQRAVSLDPNNSYLLSWAGAAFTTSPLRVSRVA